VTRRRVSALAIVAMLAGFADEGPLRAQEPITGHVTAGADVVGQPEGDHGADVELRVRAFAERVHDFGSHFRVRLGGYVDGLVADRGQPGLTTDATVRPQELYLEVHGERADLRLGYSRIVWGRLDELQPTDVINPLDLTRFFFEGRAEARLPVALIRGRLFLPRSTTLELVAVPDFRSSRFDQLDEPTAPFNLYQDIAPALAPDPSVPPLVPDRREPGVRWNNVQGGARLQTTAGRIDLGVSAYRGFEPLGMLQLETAGTVETFPRFTMIGGDFETVRGAWGIRGEVAAFVDDSFQSPTLARPLEGQSIDAGVGADRRAGNFRVSGNLLVRRRSIDDAASAPSFDRTDVNVIAAIDRSFARETRRLQVFGVYDPTEGTSFLRAIATVSLADQLSLEVSGGAFLGEGPDTLGRFSDRDFAYVRIRRAF
jgi:hypothetical protein